MRIRKATPTDAPGIAKVHVDSWRTSYAGIVPSKILSGLSYSDRQAMWEDILGQDRTDARCLVAESQESEHRPMIVGFASGGLESESSEIYRGEIYAIYLLEEFQRKGIGRALLLSLAERLLDDGVSSMLLWVFENNHSARQFYESLGGELVARKEVQIGGAEAVEVAYGWRDITALVS